VISLSTPARFGELVLMLWLVIMGAKPPVDATGSSSALVRLGFLSGGNVQFWRYVWH
jgi:hypothetical protein